MCHAIFSVLTENQAHFAHLFLHRPAGAASQIGGSLLLARLEFLTSLREHQSQWDSHQGKTGSRGFVTNGDRLSENP
jgi:hypothetical protein